MDATTLGKIDVQGPDAVEFLNRLYTNAFDSLAVGMCRYGVMCKPDGMVFDDGVVMRVGEQRFVCTTTTGNAARGARLDGGVAADRVARAARLADLGDRAVGDGRRRRPRLARRCSPRLTAIPLDAEALPVHGDPRGRGRRHPGARRAASASPASSRYEVNVDGRRGLELWEAIAAAPATVTPYGTEAMHVLRAEKGYPIVGQDTDGTVTPQDLGMDWIVSKKKPRLPRQALVRARRHVAARPQAARRPAAARPRACCAEGAQLVADPAARTGADARPRHLELSQRRARPAVRARARARAAASGSARRSTRTAIAARGRRPGALRPGGARAAMAVLSELALAVAGRRARRPAGRASRSSRTRPPSVGGAHRALARARTSGSCSAASEADFPDAAAAVDVSANRVAFELTGEGATDVLAQGLLARPRRIGVSRGRLRADAARTRTGDPSPARPCDAFVDPRPPVVRALPPRLVRRCPGRRAMTGIVPA